jgi:hypothetical protein
VKRWWPRLRLERPNVVYVHLQEVAHGMVVRDEVLPFWVGHDSLRLTAHEPSGWPRVLLLRMYEQDPRTHGYPDPRPTQVLVGAPEVN